MRVLLVAALLGVGQSNAWGAAGNKTTNVNLTFDGTATFTNGANWSYTKDAAEIFSSASCWVWANSSSTVGGAIENDGKQLRLSNGNISVDLYGDAAGLKDIVTIEFDIAYGGAYSSSEYLNTFIIKDVDGNAIVTESYKTGTNTSDKIKSSTMGVTQDDIYVKGGATDWSGKVHFAFTLNYETKKISLTTTCSSAKNKSSDFEIDMPLGTKAVGSFYVTNAKTYSDRGLLLDNIVIQTEEGDYTTSADITLAFKDDSENDISGLYTGQTVFTVDKSTTFTPSNYYPTAMYDGDYKYTYTSGGDAFTVTGDKTVTLVYTKGARPTHTLNVTANYGSKNLTIVNNVSVQEESNYTYYYPRYIKDGTTLYQYTSSTDPGASATYWTSTTTMSTTNLSYTLTYEPVDGVCVYYSEGENIASKTDTYGYYSAVSSGGTTGVFNADDGNLVVSLPAGVYTITARTVGRGDGGRDVLFYKGSVSEGNKVLTATPGYSGATATSGAISITETTNILVNGAPGGGANGRGLDYVYIMKTAESKTITSAGWATYCSPYPLDFSSAITNLDAAYLVIGGADGYVTKSEITGTIPANTGILLRGEGEVTIPVVASSATDVSANKLIGKTAEYALAAGAGYVLMNDATFGIGFYQNVNAFTVGANTAYLPANFDGGTARSFFGLWNDDETTSISEKVKVNSDKFATAPVFNLNGQRVAQPAKGLYIVGGKKVVMK